MIFAAGFGKRLEGLTACTPKPLVRAGGQALIDHALAVAEDAGISRIVVNLHYRAEAIADHLAGRPGLELAHEHPDILDTGGGLLAALPVLGPEPVFTLNSDSVWSGRNPFTQLEAAWPDVTAGALLLLCLPEQARGHPGAGDFVLDTDGRARRCQAGEQGLVYTGAQIIRTDGLSGHRQRVFSLNREWDRLVVERRLFGIVHDGEWADAGNPAGLTAASQLAERAARR